jgi:hypothetical protein
MKCYELDQLRKALADIAKVASGAAGLIQENGDTFYDGESEDKASKAKLTCTPKFVPKNLLMKAAKNAVAINSFNQPEIGALPYAAPELEITPLSIAVLTTKYWGSMPRTLTVSFMETTPADLRRRILSHLNAWARTGCIRFAETGGVGQVRISRGNGGYYSYLGTDILLIPHNRQTMNLQGFTMNTSESEFRRVVRHEAGHSLGFPHEHMRRELVARIDPDKAYKYFGGPPNNWSRSMVDQQVLTALDVRSLMATPANETSIMCYQLPGSITRDGRPILGGQDINKSDYDFVSQIYPKSVSRSNAFSTEYESAEEFEEDWDADEIEV